MEVQLQLNKAIDFFQLLYNRTIQSTKRLSGIRKYLQDLQTLFDDFSNRLQIKAYEFSKQIMKQQRDSDHLMFNYQILNNSLIKLAQSLKSICINTGQQVLQPLDMFYQNYRATNKDFFLSGKQILSSLKKHRYKIKQLTDQYFDISKEQIKTKENYQKLINKSQPMQIDINNYNSKILKLQSISNQIQQQCRAQIDVANDQWRNFYQRFPIIIGKIQYNDQSRFSFTKTSILNFLKTLTVLSFNDQYQNKLKQIQSKQQLQRQALIASIQENKQLTFLNGNAKQGFKTYRQLIILQQKKQEQTFQRMQQDSFPFAQEISQHDRQLLRDFVKLLFDKSKVIPKKQKSHKIQIQNLELSRLMLLNQKNSVFFIYLLFSKIHRQNTYFFRVTDQKYFQLIINLKLVLKTTQQNRRILLLILYRLLQISIRFRKQGQSRQTICMKLAQVNILSDKLLWVQLTQQLLNTDLLRSIKRLYANNAKAIQMLRVKKKSTLGQKVGKGLGYLKNMFKFQQKDQRTVEDKVIAVIQQIVSLLVNLNLKSQTSTDIILILAKKYQLDDQYTINLAKKLEQMKNVNIRNTKKPRQKSQLKIQLIEGKILALKLTLPFLKYCDKPFRILQVSKSVRLYLRSQIFKIFAYQDNILFKNQIHQKDQRIIRKKNILAFICNHSNFQKDYQISIKKDHSSYKQVIKLDVSRSLHLHKLTVSHQKLQKFLLVYAAIHPQISYCQGMNYLAGYCLIVFQGNQKYAYKMFCGVMKMHFSQLFDTDFTEMKVKMYQFQRILSIYLPQLSEHLKREVVSSQGFLIHWLITVFTSSFQYTLQAYLVDAIWDIFVVEGWKGFFKFIIWLLKKHQKVLLDLSYDKIMPMLGNIQKSQLFKQQGEEYKDIRAQIKNIKLTRQVMSQLKKQYQCFEVNVRQKLKLR